jgi:tartronate-semialdehyde synthase
VTDPAKIQDAFTEARSLMAAHQVPVVVEVILERVTNISMGTEINAINEFEPLADSDDDAPTSMASIKSSQ